MAGNLGGDQVSDKRRRTVIVIGGPTGAGKSTLALGLAEAASGTIINADSMQVYRELAILTARPGAADLARAPHRLYGDQPAEKAGSAGSWRARAWAAIEAAEAASRLPILVGGTGLYLEALMGGLAAIPEVPEPVRAAARERFARLGKAAFHAGLAARDPIMGARVLPSDAQRMVRAWEVLEATGRSLSAWQETRAAGPPPRHFVCIVAAPERAELYARCDARFRAMVGAGALEEVRRLLDLALPAGLPAMKALGVAELGRHLAGEITLEAAITEAQAATRHYAKRQNTWFRNRFAQAYVWNAKEPDRFLAAHFTKIRPGQLTEA